MSLQEGSFIQRCDVPTLVTYLDDKAGTGSLLIFNALLLVTIGIDSGTRTSRTK